MTASFSALLWAFSVFLTFTPLLDSAAAEVLAWSPSEHANGFSQMNVPNALSNVVAISAGVPKNVVLIHQPGLPAPRLDLSRGMSGLELRAHGTPGMSCQLLRASQLPGPWLPSAPVTFVQGS